MISAYDEDLEYKDILFYCNIDFVFFLRMYSSLLSQSFDIRGTGNQN